MDDFTDKGVVITGGATGIGFAFARRLGAEGAKIVLAGPDQAALDTAIDHLKSRGVEAHGCLCDITDRDQVEALADFAWGKLGTVQVIFNNAGVGGKQSPVITASRAEIDAVMAVNFYGVWHGSAVFGQRFIDQGEPAAIYNLGSENSFYNFVPHNFAYGASKHGVLAMTDALRREVPDFIQVALIFPGVVTTAMTGPLKGMDLDDFVDVALKQLRAGEFFVVSHAYNMVRIQDRYDEIAKAYASYAPRYEGDADWDVPTLIEKMKKGRKDHE